MNSKSINILVFICGLIIGLLSVTSPTISSKDKVVHETTSSNTPVSKPASGEKTYLPKPPKKRYA